MSAVMALAAVARERRRLTVVSDAMDGDGDVPPAIACLVRSALQDLDEAAGLLRGRLDRRSLVEGGVG